MCECKRVVAKFEKVSPKEFRHQVSYKTLFVTNDKTLRDLKMPCRKTKGSAGYDFHSPFSFSLNPNEEKIIPLGIRCKMDEDVVLQIFPRSSLGFNYNMVLCNTVGIIDSDYYNSPNEGHIMVKIRNTGNKRIDIYKGHAICQGVFTRYLLADEEPVTKKRTGGFGSTGK